MPSWGQTTGSHPVPSSQKEKQMNIPLETDCDGESLTVMSHCNPICGCCQTLGFWKVGSKDFCFLLLLLLLLLQNSNNEQGRRNLTQSYLCCVVSVIVVDCTLYEEWLGDPGSRTALPLEPVQVHNLRFDPADESCLP